MHAFQHILWDGTVYVCRHSVGFQSCSPASYGCYGTAIKCCSSSCQHGTPSTQLSVCTATRTQVLQRRRQHAPRLTCACNCPIVRNCFRMRCLLPHVQGKMSLIVCVALAKFVCTSCCESVIVTHQGLLRPSACIQRGPEPLCCGVSPQLPAAAMHFCLAGLLAHSSH